MQGVPTGHPPGAVAMSTGETFRYSLSAQSFTHLMVPPGSMNCWFMGVLVAKNLNLAISTALADPKIQWVWVMGDDHVYNPNIIIKLLDREKDVIVPLCLNRTPPLDPAIAVWKDMHAEIPLPHKGENPEDLNRCRLKRIEDLPTSGLYQLQENETCGDAGMLIRRNVLEKIGYPWYDRLRTGAYGSFNADDQEFVMKIKAAGFDIWVDLDVPIGHITPITVTPVVRDGQWEVRLQTGIHKVVDLKPQRAK
mgnify:CR=1 FL=1